MKNEFLSHLRENPIVQYAVRHLAESKLQFHGDVTLDHYRQGSLLHTQTGHNTFTTEGMNDLLNIIFGTTAKTGAAIFYVGIFKINATPGLTDTAATKLGSASTGYGECQDADYSPATNKPAYTIAAAAAGVCTNAAAAATFTMAAAITVYGAFLSTSPAKTATDGKLYCAKKFGSSRLVAISDVLAVSYVITLSTS